MHAVSIGGDRNVGVIIDDEERTVDMGQPAKCQRDGVLLALGHRLLSKLDDVGATLQRRLDGAHRLGLAAVITGDHVQAHAGQLLASFFGDSHICHVPDGGGMLNPFPPQVSP